MCKDEIDSLRNLKYLSFHRSSWNLEGIRGRRITREMKLYSGFLPLPSGAILCWAPYTIFYEIKTLSAKIHIFTKILFTDLLRSLYSSWLKWLVLDQFTATSCSQRIRLEIPTRCSVVFSLFRLDPVAKEEKTKRKIEIRHQINKMMYNKVATLIKHTSSHRVLLYTSEICNWIKKKYFRSFISVTQAWNGGGVTGWTNQQTDCREEIASSLVKTRDNLECKAIHYLLREVTIFWERSSKKTVS